MNIKYMLTKKRIFIISFSIIVASLLLVLLFFYIKKPDLVIQNIVFSEDQYVCKYSVEIKNKGFAPVNEIVAYCFEPEGKGKCKFLWDVVNRNPETGKTDPLTLAAGENYKFNVVNIPKSTFGGTCPDKLHFCIDCNLRIEYEKEIVDGSVKELNEGNNDFTFIK